jgi:hypothetical protein
MFLHLDARQREQILDQPRHAPGLFVHNGEKPDLRLCIFACRPLQRFDIAKQAGQGCLEFVTDIGDEVGPHPFGLFQGGEIVEYSDCGIRRILAQRLDPDREMPF